MNRGNNGKNEKKRNAFNFSGFYNQFKRQEAAAKAAATRRKHQQAARTRFSTRKRFSTRTAAAAVSHPRTTLGRVKLNRTKRARVVFGRTRNQKKPIRKTNTHRLMTIKPKSKTQNTHSEKTILNTNTRPTATKPIREQIKKIQSSVESISKDINPNAIKHYINQYNHYTNILKIKELSDEDRALLEEAVSILLLNPAVQEAASRMANSHGAAAMTNNSTSAAAAVPASKKERTFHTRQLKPIIEKYMAKGQVEKAIPFIQLLSTRTDRTPADDVLLSQYPQFIPNYQASQADIDELESLTSSIAGISMGPAAPPPNNLSNL
jgi:hypothetical protein